MLVTEETKVLLNFLVFAFDFTVTFRVVGSSKASFNTKTLVESLYELGCELGTTIREDFLQNSVKAENIPIVKISGAFGR
jgi:hypothetical protein